MLHADIGAEVENAVGVQLQEFTALNIYLQKRRHLNDDPLENISEDTINFRHLKIQQILIVNMVY